MGESLRLDDLYKMTAHIYSEQNAHRPAAATFAHFVEVCGFLSMHARKKKREEVSFEDALCKALGWYFPLMAKFRVSSVEELLFRKYPYACPYCRQTPHVDAKCKTVQGTKRTVDHPALRRKYAENKSLRPRGLGEWQEMYAKVYPRTLEDSPRSVVGLFEELGELAEAVRVFDRHPKYFAGEAADVFSYLMGLANEYTLHRESNDQAPFDFEAEYLKRYPGLCVQCGYQVCICPLVPDSTVGRMAKELDIDGTQGLFGLDFESNRAEAIRVSDRVLAKVGGYGTLALSFPFDRGEANRRLVLACLDLADKVDDKDVAERLRSAALKAGTAVTYAGSPKQPARLKSVLEPVQQVYRESKSEIASALGLKVAGLSESIEHIVIHEYVAGDKYSSSHVGIQGPVAHTRNIRVAQTFVIPEGVTLPEIASDLEKVRTELQRSPEQHQDTAEALKQVSEAATAAKEGDGNRVMEALSKFGDWVLDIATKIGAAVLVETMKKNGMV